MPNWVRNTLQIKAKHTPLIIQLDGTVDFNILIPMPEELNIEDSSDANMAIYYYLSHRGAMSIQEVKDNTIACEVITDIIDKHPIAYAEHQMRNAIQHNKSLNWSSVYDYGKKLVNNHTKYGAKTWYDWRNKNWGCKWNASNSKIHFDGDNAIIEFYTPWTAPEAWLQALTNRGIPFYLEWHEEQGYRGEYISDGINLTVNDLPFDNSFYDDDDDDEDD